MPISKINIEIVFGSYQQVIPWHTKRLQLNDLSKMKLVGLEKARKTNPSLLPLCVKVHMLDDLLKALLIFIASLQRYVTVLDYEVGELCTPPYMVRGIAQNVIFSIAHCYCRVVLLTR